jgi:multiple sugar transport system ATP-binding protein
MNLLEATFEPDGDDAGVLVLGSQRFPLGEEVMRRFPDLRGRRGKKVVLGIRAGDLHLASGRPELPTLTAKLELVEALGAESIAYFRIEAESIRAADVEDEEDLDADGDGVGVTATRPNLVASFDARDTLALKLDDEIPVAVDVARIHLFDAETGAPLR